MWHGVDDKLAMKVWHWPFLAQKYPMPEMLIEKAPIEYLDYKMASWTKARDLSAFDPRALAHGLRERAELALLRADDEAGVVLVDDEGADVLALGARVELAGASASQAHPQYEPAAAQAVERRRAPVDVGQDPSWAGRGATRE
mgnify:CR=1 FL=1